MDYCLQNINSLTRMGMRKSFGHIMMDLVDEHQELVVLTADVASSAGLKDFAEKYPSRFYNVGIAEQNMVGIAAGLAKEGANVFITSFASFASMRCYEAIRTLVGYMNLNVKIVGLASGLSLGVQGNTHYCFEDISLMRTIPGIKILSPADCTEEMKCLAYMSNYNGPVYLRLTGIDGTPCVYKSDYEFNADSMIELKEGKDIIILATGSVVNESLRVARALKKENIGVAVYDVHTLKPFDSNTFTKIRKTAKLIVTVEEHSIIGGLGTIVADELSTIEKHPRLIKIGIHDTFVKAGDYSYLLKEVGLSAQEMKDKIMSEYLQSCNESVEANPPQ